MKFNVVLFEDFETLDVFGPVEAIGMLKKFMKDYYEIEFYSKEGGIIRSNQNVRVDTLPLSDIKEDGILLIPGGFGTRKEVDNRELIRRLKDLSDKARYVLTVCTGTALLARTGIIKGIRATTNKMSFNWVEDQDKDVIWIRRARWVHDGKFYTSSGVSAGIDMTLSFISDMMGLNVAKQVATGMEYIWNSDKDSDPFAKDE
ncbi:MAG: DJ-1/PfpI family protein [Clostridiaceae bacterium]